ncbi:MAG: sigma-54 dependent transcriptional regulator [Myxococcota bacterium]
MRAHSPNDPSPCDANRERLSRNHWYEVCKAPRSASAMPDSTRTSNTPIHVVLVEDNPLEREVVAMLLQHEGFVVSAFGDAETALDALQAGAPASVLVTDLDLPGLDGVDLVGHAKSLRPQLAVIVMTGFGTVATAVSAMQRGAYDFLVKPLNPPELLPLSIRRAVEHAELGARNAHLEALLDPHRDESELLIGSSEVMQRVKQEIRLIATTPTTTLIVGETGTGKELAARSLHLLSPRRHEPFITVNCGALPSSILESELFGYVRGAFTGAATSRAGLFEAATAGTLFLDEVGAMSVEVQAALLRVLQEGEVRRLGSTTTRRVDTRVIAATNESLESLVAHGRFRSDLRYRLDVAHVHLPPLRERKSDLPALMARFLRLHAERADRRAPRLSTSALEQLFAYDWPGNVRELSNCAARLIIATPPKVELIDRLPDFILPLRVATAPPPRARFPSNMTRGPLKEARTEFDRWYIAKALRRHDGKLGATARELHLDPSNLRRLMTRLGMRDD